jgi:hypothetical protein
MTDFVLRCDGCGLFNWNLANEGQPHETDTPEARQIAEAKGRTVCKGTWRNTGRSYAEWDAVEQCWRGRYSATVFGEAKPFAYSAHEDVILRSAQRKLATLKPHQYIIVADRREHKTVATLEVPAKHKASKE